MPLWLRTKKCSHVSEAINMSKTVLGKDVRHFEVQCRLLLVWLSSMNQHGCLMFSSSLKWTSWESDKHRVCAPFSRFSWHAPFPKAFTTRYYTFRSPTRADTRALAGPHAEHPNRGFNLNPFKNHLIQIHNVHRMKTFISYLLELVEMRWDKIIDTFLIYS